MLRYLNFSATTPQKNSNLINENAYIINHSENLSAPLKKTFTKMSMELIREV
jgi:hypothetical protein